MCYAVGMGFFTESATLLVHISVPFKLCVLANSYGTLFGCVLHQITGVVMSATLTLMVTVLRIVKTRVLQIPVSELSISAIFASSTWILFEGSNKRLFGGQLAM